MPQANQMKGAESRAESTRRKINGYRIDKSELVTSPVRSDTQDQRSAF